MLRIMVIRKDEGDERPVFGVGQVLGEVQGDSRQAGEVAEALQEATEEAGESGSANRDPPYNRDEEGVELSFAGKLTGGRKLRDCDVIRLRRNVEQLSINWWAKVFGVSGSVIWNAMKGYSYKHLNWQHPPIR